LAPHLKVTAKRPAKASARRKGDNLVTEKSNHGNPPGARKWRKYWEAEALSIRARRFLQRKWKGGRWKEVDLRAKKSGPQDQQTEGPRGREVNRDLLKVGYTLEGSFRGGNNSERIQGSGGKVSELFFEINL